MTETRSPIVRQLEQEIAMLPFEDKLWLIAQIAQQLQPAATRSEKELEIQQMANDPQIQAEIAAIDREFAATLMDGLES